MKKLMIILFFSALLIGCSGNKSADDSQAGDSDEMEKISADAQKTAKELQEETDKLENSVDSLLSDI